VRLDRLLAPGSRSDTAHSGASKPLSRNHLRSLIHIIFPDEETALAVRFAWLECHCTGLAVREVGGATSSVGDLYVDGRCQSASPRPLQLM
jgi:hypothetical protein